MSGTGAEAPARAARRPLVPAAPQAPYLGAATLVLLTVAVAGAVYELLKRFNANLEQDNIRGLLGGR